MDWDRTASIDRRATASIPLKDRNGWVQRSSGLFVPRQPRPSAIRQLLGVVMSAGRLVSPVVLVEILRRLLGSTGS
jgi:hypothetical protein